MLELPVKFHQSKPEKRNTPRIWHLCDTLTTKRIKPYRDPPYKLSVYHQEVSQEDYNASKTPLGETNFEKGKQQKRDTRCVSFLFRTNSQNSSCPGYLKVFFFVFCCIEIVPQKTPLPVDSVYIFFNHAHFLDCLIPRSMTSLSHSFGFSLSLFVSSLKDQ